MRLYVYLWLSVCKKRLKVILSFLWPFGDLRPLPFPRVCVAQWAQPQLLASTELFLPKHLLIPRANKTWSSAKPWCKYEADLCLATEQLNHAAPYWSIGGWKCATAEATLRGGTEKPPWAPMKKNELDAQHALFLFFRKDSINLASCSIQPENLDPFSSSLLIKTYSRGWMLCYCVGANWSKHVGTIKSSFTKHQLWNSSNMRVCVSRICSPLVLVVMTAKPMICHLGHFQMK